MGQHVPGKLLFPNAVGSHKFILPSQAHDLEITGRGQHRQQPPGPIPQWCRGWRAVHSAPHPPLPSAWELPCAHHLSTLSKKHVPYPCPWIHFTRPELEMGTGTKVPPCQQGPELPLPTVSSPEPGARRAGRSNCPLVRSHMKLRLVGGCFPHSMGWKAEEAAARREKKEAGAQRRREVFYTHSSSMPGPHSCCSPPPTLSSSCKSSPGSPPQ